MKQQFHIDDIVSAGALRCRVQLATMPGQAPIPHCWSYQVIVIGWLDSARSDPCPDAGLVTWFDEQSLSPVS